MRPEILFPLFREITALPGIGPRLQKPLARLAGETVVDLLWHLPADLIDRRYRPTIAEAEPGRIATIAVTVLDHVPSRHRRAPYRVRCEDASGTLTLVYFNGREDYLRRLLPEGQARLVSGRVEAFGGEAQMTHPDYVVAPDDRTGIPPVEAVYPLTAGLSNRVLAKAVRAALADLPTLPDWLDPAYKAKQGWTDWKPALLAAHAPTERDDLAAAAPARSRLAYDELLANQLALALVRRAVRRRKGRPLAANGRITAAIQAALPYRLTSAQDMALAEIGADLRSGNRMLRLLQGDVGSGKTVVALLAIAQAVEAGAQAALMAPTEILARQHLASLTPLCEAAGMRLALLTGRDKGRKRAALLEALAAGEIDLLVGTHALFQDDVRFRDLGLVVIDEQHRFGVHQRLALQAKTRGPEGAAHVLVMTATPIPRTLTLTAYGDMDVSQLREKPPGRQPVDTRVLGNDRIDDVIERLAALLARGARAYWVCPLVAESETDDRAAAEARAADLRLRLAGRVSVGLVHGQMPAAEKDAAMTAFAAGEVQLLVATTVIEVGVDVPEATVMVIEGAERFGLAQLHQLRGRVGRGQDASHCLLLYTPPLGETMRARLEIMRQTDDGFLIAEEDLRLRGAGELLGTRQSGLPQFRLADLGAHQSLMLAARDDAKLILERDPDLAGERGSALRVLLYLFARDSVVETIASG
ncbi:ATP-dependent DNA helicase RecG [Oceanibacterium hippocampi]|uniref:ATP-dependent DNA helicase RecG n=1 Tax=Oceanibacterium hippocampi TaxID=745714 RepID=A0A1Y5T3R9_9PROT|nr:ATP-dependent DNA helicase RecG [Oceanibacterium hippocampi]SLN55091.1 ATP-dependent DNA helicase RecG [Oceanibacterium hippocampi]